jgi:hypothetical protein
MRRLANISVITCVLLLVSISPAQQAAAGRTTVPNLIRYSGTLKGEQGSLVPLATRGVTFAIYQQQDGGAPLWMETQSVTSDANGNYSVLLGRTTATGLPGDLFSPSEERWLGVQVQGEPEQPRIMLVSVPYAFKAHDAETLGGKSVSDFVLADGTTDPTNSASTASPRPATATGASLDVTSDGPTNFSGSTTDQIVSVMQSGTGAGLKSSAPTLGISGTATAASGTAYGVQGVANGTAGVGLIGTATSTTGATYGLRGTSSSTSGTGVRGINNATSGSTTGVSGYVASAAGTAGVFNNAAGGKIVSLQNNSVEKFAVDGQGNVTASGTLTGNGSGLTGIAFSNLSGSLGSSQFTGTYSHAVTLSNTSNNYYGNGSNLTGIVNSMGSPYYVQNGTMQQTNTSFNIDGNGTVGGTLSATTVNTITSSNNQAFQINGRGVFGIGNIGNNSLFAGVGAGANDINGEGIDNVFLGAEAGASNNTGSLDTFSGYKAGYVNTSGGANTFVGAQAGSSNIAASDNTFVGSSAGSMSTAAGNTFIGSQAGKQNTSGSSNTFTGTESGGSNNTASGNTFYGMQTGFYNTTGANNTFAGLEAGANNTTGNYNTYLGWEAGTNSTTGSNNVYIANLGCPASCTEASTIRIGGDLENGYGSQTATYIAGIYGSTSSAGLGVFINSDGKLGTTTSSLRFKEQVRDMGGRTDALMKLRPVTFLYKPEYADSGRTLQYGLIAEEVAKVYPELVAYDKDGLPYSVRYQYLSTMLLNEMQKQYHREETQAQTIAAQAQKIQQLEERLSRLEKMLVNQAQFVAQK